MERERQPFAFRPGEIFQLLWQITKYPLVLRLTAVFLFFHITNVTFYVFVDNYMTSRFGYGTLGGSMMMLTIGVSYATFLGLYAASVGDEEQGWIMGITTAVFTLVSGVMSLIGGELMSVSIRAPFYIVIVAALIGVTLLFQMWNKPEIERLLRV